MIKYAKDSSKVEYIILLLMSLLTHPNIEQVINAGLDKVNISIDGMTEETYKTFTKFDVDFKMVENIKYFYSIKVIVKWLLKYLVI